MLRRLWEEKWGRPSRGEPLFECVPLELHAQDLVRMDEIEDAQVMDEIDRLAALGLDPFEWGDL